MLILPYGQSIFHEVSPVGPASPGVLVAIVGIIACAGAAWRSRRGHGLASLGVFWFLLLLVPSSVLVLFDRGEPMAEHRVYVASMGAFLIAGLAVDRLVGWLAVRGATSTLVLASVTVAIVVAFGGRTYLRNEIWSDPLVVWLEAAERAPDSWFPALMLGEELHRVGQHDQAIGAFRRAVSCGRASPALMASWACAWPSSGIWTARKRSSRGSARSILRRRRRRTDWRRSRCCKGDLKTARLRYLDTLAIDQIEHRRAARPGGD